MQPYDQLIEVIEAFIDSDSFNGGMRVRGIKTALLIQQASLEGDGITVSELARATGAPLENVRRHMAKHVELGGLRYEADPDDDRATRIVTANPDVFAADVAAIVERLAAIDWGER